MIAAEKLELLRTEDLPRWFSYPPAFIHLVESGMTQFDPWWIFDRKYAKEKLEGLKIRYPERSLVPFARNQSNDDVACWDRDVPGKVVVIHDYADPGWEVHATFDSFQDWFRSAMEDFIDVQLS